MEGGQRTTFGAIKARNQGIQDSISIAQTALTSSQAWIRHVRRREKAEDTWLGMQK